MWINLEITQICVNKLYPYFICIRIAHYKSKTAFDLVPFYFEYGNIILTKVMIKYFF